MIDGGYRRRSQDTGKSAADFVDWKFEEDYGKDTIKLEAMLGPEKTLAGERFLTRLMGDRNEVEKVLQEGAKPELQGQWRDLMEAVAAAKWTDGKPTEIKRLRDRDEYVPELGPGIEGEPTIKVLAPVEFEVERKPALRSFKDESLNTNGNSLLLSINLGSCRILLTGDLNKDSQNALLADYKGRREEFLCDVGKACHHGSADVAFSFLQAMSPAVTVFSSGDNEGHDHPRPSIIAASAIAGHITQDEKGDKLVTPLIYSTELARSIRLGDPNKLEYEAPPDAEGRVEAKVEKRKKTTLEGERFEQGTVFYTETKPGDLNPGNGNRPMDRTKIVSGLIYGLVNVRTDGEKILCATLDEKDYSWRVETTMSRF